MVCDSVIPDELAFKWAEVVFGAFADASGEIKEVGRCVCVFFIHIATILISPWLTEAPHTNTSACTHCNI